MCVACKIRSHTVEKCDDFVRELCPECGSLLEPVDGLSSVLGFQLIDSRDYDADADAAAGGSGDQVQIADCVQDMVSRRSALLALERFDAEFDDYGGGAGLSTGAVALPWPDTNT
jgi:hypothetical protein